MMCSTRFFLFMCLLTVVVCDDKKYGHHGHHLYFHEFYYLIFLALKFKIILVIGSIWTFGLVIAKIFAFFKISEYMKKHRHEDHYEKVVYESPHDSYPHYSGPEIYGKTFEGNSYPSDLSSYSSDITFDHLPPNAAGDSSYPGDSQYSGDYLHGGLERGGGTKEKFVAQYDQQNTYARSVKKDTTGVYKYFKSLSKLIKRYNITELVFKEMNIKSQACKRKFVCEADYNSNQSIILKAAFGLLSDDQYQKYKKNNTAKSIDECATINSNCLENT